MVRQMKGHISAAWRETLAGIIQSKATAINRPNLEKVQPKDVERIRILPRDRIFCIACGVPLYVDSKNKTIQVADSVFAGGGNGCKVKIACLKGAQDH